MEEYSAKARLRQQLTRKVGVLWTKILKNKYKFIYLFVRFRLCYNYSRSVVLLGFLIVISRNYNLIVLWKLFKKSRQNIHNTPIRDC